MLMSVSCHYPQTGDTAASLGSAMDELMRHQPSLKADAMKAIIKVGCTLGWVGVVCFVCLVSTYV